MRSMSVVNLGFTTGLGTFDIAAVNAALPVPSHH